MSSEHVRRRLRVSGQVQGVFFRASTRRVAREAGVTGWVRNDVDGSVAVEVQGPEDAVDRVVDFCREGPQYASVDSCVVTEISTQDDDSDFVIR